MTVEEEETPDRMAAEPSGSEQDEPDTGPVVLAISGLEFEHPSAAAVICEAEEGTKAEIGREDVIWRVRRGGSAPQGARVCVAEGLDAAAELAVGTPDMVVVPRAEVRRASSRYGFNPAITGSGFSTYHLDPASVQAFSVRERGRTVALGEWLSQAQTLGFREVWLHGVEAQEAGRGFACDLLAKAHRIAPRLQLWISGGGREPAHFANAARLPGLVALVVEAQVLAEMEPGAVNAALMGPPPPSEPPCGAA